jgi:hypothetical protein
MALEVAAGDLTVQDPEADLVYRFDWDTGPMPLPIGVSIAASGFEIAIKRPHGDATALAALTADQRAIDPNGARQTQVRLSGGVAGALYRITNVVTTDETPSEIRVASVNVLIERC